MVDRKKLAGTLADAARAMWRIRNNRQSVETHHLARLAERGLAETELHYQTAAGQDYDERHAAERELVQVANEAEEQLAAIEFLMGRSQADSEDFGEALQDTAKEMANHNDRKELLFNLINLTNTMISKTRDASDELALRRSQMAKMRSSLHEARARADTDMLTQLRNRHRFERDLIDEIERCTVNGEPLTLSICDIDNFKDVNDQFGHQTGDGVLRLVAKILSDHCDNDGFVYRLGGEEFAIILPGYSEEHAFTLIERTRKDLAGRKIRERKSGQAIGMVTFSGGVATALKCNRETADALFYVADRELYVAKEAGRNRISCAMLED